MSNVSCGICDSGIDTLDTHTSTCQGFECNWCNKRFYSISDIKRHSKQDHKGKNHIYHYIRMRIDKEFFQKIFFPFKDLV